MYRVSKKPYDKKGPLREKRIWLKGFKSRTYVAIFLPVIASGIHITGVRKHTTWRIFPIIGGISLNLVEKIAVNIPIMTNKKKIVIKLNKKKINDEKERSILKKIYKGINKIILWNKIIKFLVTTLNEYTKNGTLNCFNNIVLSINIVVDSFIDVEINPQKIRPKPRYGM